jgi:hypothetical protein
VYIQQNYYLRLLDMFLMLALFYKYKKFNL